MDPIQQEVSLGSGELVGEVPERPERPLRPWQLERAFLFLFLVAVAMVAVALLMQAILPQGTQAEPPTWLLAGGTGIFHAMVFVLVRHLMAAHGFGWRDAFGFGRTRAGTLWTRVGALTVPALVAAWAIHAGCVWLLEQLSLAHDPQTAVAAVQKAGRAWERLFLFVFAVGTAPLMEEMLFRGILWPMFRDRGWRVTGGIGVSLLFALNHGNMAALLPLWLLGIFWTWLYERTGDLSAPILSHALFNATNFAWLILAEPGRAG